MKFTQVMPRFKQLLQLRPAIVTCRPHGLAARGDSDRLPGRLGGFVTSKMVDLTGVPWGFSWGNYVVGFDEWNFNVIDWNFMEIRGHIWNFILDKSGKYIDSHARLCLVESWIPIG